MQQVGSACYVTSYKMQATSVTSFPYYITWEIQYSAKLIFCGSLIYKFYKYSTIRKIISTKIIDTQHKDFMLWL